MPAPTALPACPDCGHTPATALGALPDVAFFAGRRLVAPLPGGRLLRCAACDLRWRWPLVTGFEQLYDNSAVDAWTMGPMRQDQQLVHDIVVSRGQARNVLDFGCYSGEFLARLPARLQRYGVEVSAAAAALAHERAGATVKATLAQQAADLRFDVVVAMDVIEHVPSPRALLGELLERLAPGGLLIITTGDGANALWRMVGPRWWYCYFPEHIAFISRRWLEVHVPAAGAKLLDVQTFNYLQQPGAAKRWWGWLKYLVRPAHQARKRVRHLQETGRDLGVPGGGLVRDHLLVQVAR
ncbi:MAG: class I SAM-dependent methyltransferase [Rubrivivax sp.]|nr:class I SAM-dependent methyltransferase [Rubrivivax sp.]